MKMIKKLKKKLFKKNLIEKTMEELKDNTPKVKMKKKTIIIIEVVCAVLIFATLLGIKYLITNKVDKNVVKLENQLISNITFSDFVLKYKDEKSYISVNLINYSKEEIKINKLTIKLYASDNTKVSEILVDYLNNSAPLVLGENQSTEVSNIIELDLTDIIKVEYVIE